jgi:hypothetical protein
MRVNQRVSVVGRSGKVVRVGRKRQGGAWVGRLWVRYDDTGAVRRAMVRNTATGV